MRLRWAICATVVSLLLGIAATALGHTASFRTASSFGYDPARADFLGDINFGSGNQDCRPGRKVRVFRVRGGDEVLAKVLPKRVAAAGHVHSCGAYRSSTLAFG